MMTAEVQTRSVRAFMRTLAQMTPAERSEFLAAYQTHVAAAGEDAVSPARFAKSWLAEPIHRHDGVAQVVMFQVDQLPDTYATQLDGLAAALERWHTHHELPPVHLDANGAVRSGHASIAAARLLDLQLVPTIAHSQQLVRGISTEQGACT